MIIRETLCFHDNFQRAQTLSTTPGHKGWTSKKTGNGTPSGVCINGGGLKLLLDNTNEAQVFTAYHNDVLPFALAQLQRLEMILAVGGVDAVTTILAGLGTAEDDTPGSVAENLWFKILGSGSLSALLIDTKDGGGNTNTGVATAATLSTTPKKFVIDFGNGLTDVRFFIDGAPVARSTTFDLSAQSSVYLQPYLQVAKASGTGVPYLIVHKFALEYKRVLGS